jgi:hypothetical protein
MATTPEAKVKAKITRALEALQAKGFPVYYHMPVQNGMGKPTLDFICCFNGNYLGIEAKAPGQKPTDRQYATFAEINAAGGTTIAYDGSCPKELTACLLMLLK